MKQINRDKVDDQLRGNTLRVYWYVLRSKSGSVGVREAQRALGFSSPTLAQYHLEKLRELGLVRKESTEYQLVPEVKVGLLRSFVKVGSVFLPRFVLYGSLFSVMVAYYVSDLLLSGVAVDFRSVYGLALGALAASVLWYEAVRAWRERPSIE